MLKVNGMIGASLVTGTEKVRCGFGNGDCLLLDFEQGVFAIADASERYPQASRNLLDNFANDLSKNGPPTNPNELRERIQKIWITQPFHHTSTFSCIALNRSADKIKIFVFHGGDSMVMILDILKKSILFKTYSDMNFAGRSRNLPEVTTLTIEEGRYKIILATDGLNDFIKQFNDKTSLIQSGFSLPEFFFSQPTHEISDELRQELKRNINLEYDDMGIIVLDPFSLKTFTSPIILIGGTSSNSETKYHKHILEENSDQWLPAAIWTQHADLLKIAGIQILSNS